MYKLSYSKYGKIQKHNLEPFVDAIGSMFEIINNSAVN